MPVARLAARLERHDTGSGTWVVVEGDGRILRVRSGTTGNRVDPDRRVPRSCWEVRRIGDDLELLATWPVSELVTHRIGEHVEQLVDDLDAAGGDPSSDLGVLATALDPVLRDGGAPGSLPGRLWAAAYPLLRVPLAQGAALARLPVALDRLLRAPDARAAATRCFRQVTRPLVRALAASLLPAGPGQAVPFEPVLLALMATPWCGPEQVTGILRTPPARAGAVAFDVGDIQRSRALFEAVPPRRVADRLRQALEDPDGTRQLAEEIAAWRPRPSTAEAPAPRQVAPARAPTPAGGLRPPPRTDVALRHPEDLRRLEGVTVAGHVLCLPRTADELVAWGRALDNCLGGYRHAVAGGRTHVVGLRSPDGRLRYAVELTRARTVRQFEGPANRQAPADVAAPVLALLLARGVARADGRTGHSLLAPR